MIEWNGDGFVGLSPDDSPAPLAAAISIRNGLLITLIVALLCIAVGGLVVSCGAHYVEAAMPVVSSADWMWDG